MTETKCEWCKAWVPENVIIFVYPGIPVCWFCYQQAENEALVRWGEV